MAGNVSQRNDDRWEKRLRAVGLCVEHLERYADPGQMEDVCLTEIRFKLDADYGTSVLCILKGTRDGSRIVGFVGAPDLTGCVLATGKKVAAGAVKWREDRPWEG